MEAQRRQLDEALSQAAGVLQKDVEWKRRTQTLQALRTGLVRDVCAHLTRTAPGSVATLGRGTLDISAMRAKVEADDAARVSHLANIFPHARALRESVAAQTVDLRSQLAREACEIVAAFAQDDTINEWFGALFGDALIPALLKQSGATKQVMSSSAVQALRSIMLAAPLPSRVLLAFLQPLLVGDVVGRTKRVVAELIAHVLRHQPGCAIEIALPDIEHALTAALSDADEQVRRNARASFLVLETLLPGAAHRILHRVDSTTQKNIEKERGAKTATRSESVASSKPDIVQPQNTLPTSSLKQSGNAVGGAARASTTSSGVRSSAQPPLRALHAATRVSRTVPLHSTAGSAVQMDPTRLHPPLRSPVNAPSGSPTAQTAAVRSAVSGGPIDTMQMTPVPVKDARSLPKSMRAVQEVEIDPTPARIMSSARRSELQRASRVLTSTSHDQHLSGLTPSVASSRFFDGTYSQQAGGLLSPSMAPSLRATSCAIQKRHEAAKHLQFVRDQLLYGQPQTKLDALDTMFETLERAVRNQRSFARHSQDDEPVTNAALEVLQAAFRCISPHLYRPIDLQRDLAYNPWLISWLLQLHENRSDEQAELALRALERALSSEQHAAVLLCALEHVQEREPHVSLPVLQRLSDTFARASQDDFEIRLAFLSAFVRIMSSILRVQPAHPSALQCVRLFERVIPPNTFTIAASHFAEEDVAILLDACRSRPIAEDADHPQPTFADESAKFIQEELRSSSQYSPHDQICARLPAFEEEQQLITTVHESRHTEVEGEAECVRGVLTELPTVAFYELSEASEERRKNELSGLRELNECLLTCPSGSEELRAAIRRVADYLHSMYDDVRCSALSILRDAAMATPNAFDLSNTQRILYEALVPCCAATYRVSALFARRVLRVILQLGVPHVRDWALDHALHMATRQPKCDDTTLLVLFHIMTVLLERTGQTWCDATLQPRLDRLLTDKLVDVCARYRGHPNQWIRQHVAVVEDLASIDPRHDDNTSATATNTGTPHEKENARCHTEWLPRARANVADQNSQLKSTNSTPAVL
ncbi:CLIP-associating protein 2 [Porphyridium purpureum]|uniref:CLIP-associating protein 2 n=1 Tax=Porphyridium purpureum TaxID=35688 RepID=A0A5J4YSX1_PORPP|nr:CLIP-associating protein 2 [Porphyridium purpureum]|eukprot:POR0703..scf229_5